MALLLKKNALVRKPKPRKRRQNKIFTEIITMNKSIMAKKHYRQQMIQNSNNDYKYSSKIHKLILSDKTMKNSIHE